ncbi:MAG: DUF4382 domain-containing protein [Dehalococcoidia bacterium]|nr:DUF4382 domain-containing protein [Dehalococcoidia bacterium]
MRRLCLKVITFVVVLVIVLVGVGCQGGGGASQPVANGTLIINVTDAPPKAEVMSIMLTLTKLAVHKSPLEGDQAGAEEGEWLEIAVPDTAKTFDLLKIKGIEQLLTTAQVSAGKYTQVRLTVEKAEVTLKDKAAEPAVIPGGALKLVHPFEIVAGETTAVTLDFDAEKMVNVTGQGKIQVKPVIKLTVKPPKSAKTAKITVENSQKIAEDFLKNSPTFAFDGIKESFTLMTKTMVRDNTWQFIFEFDSRQAGYGDRTGRMLAQVITHHQALVTIENGNVTEAILDGKWNEMTQEEVQASRTN